MAKNVVFDEDSAARIAAAVKWVEQFLAVPPASPYDETSILPDTMRKAIFGRFSGVWDKDSDKTVLFTADDGTEGNKTASNKLMKVGLEGEETECLIIYVGSEWCLSNAKESTTCQNLSYVEPTGNLTLVSNVTVNGSFISGVSGIGEVVTNVACVDGNLVVTTANLSNLTTAANFSDHVTVAFSNVTLSDFAEVTTENLTLPENRCSNVSD